MSTIPDASVLCAYPVSSTFDLNHRLVYYLALAILLLAPKHRWITPAAFGFVTLYSAFSTFYVGALAIVPTRLGPSLDIFPLSNLFLVNTYALAATVFCRTSLLKGKRQWMRVVRMFVWSWVGFIASTMTKASFEKMAKAVAVDVQCFADNSTSTFDNLFSIGKGLSCENPCSLPGLSSAHQLHEQLSPILWGKLDEATNTFEKMPIPTLSASEYFVVILFAVALAATLWLNFFTSPQMTRNTIFSTLIGGKTDSRVRVGIAKVGALLWYAWSYFTLLLVALAVPMVSYVGEVLLVKYPSTKNACFMKQWLPWVVAIALFLVKIAFWRRRRETLSKEKACRIRRFNTALRQLQGNTDQVSLLPEHYVAPATIVEKKPASKAIEAPQTVKKHRIEIAEARKVNGFVDTFSEFKTWWVNPMGTQDEDDFPSVDEEKALLKERYDEQ